MKIVIIGAGSYRTLGILRSAMKIPGVLDAGEVNLYDLNTTRSETMGRMLLKTPEYRRAQPRITWGTSIEAALEGASAVGVILPALPPREVYYSAEVCARHGFISSDNVSPAGAFCAVSIAPVIMDIARKMERYCPDALFLDFVNPIAVLSGMINNHTRIRALGLCGGFTNHLWDISRLCGRDEQSNDIDVTTAGINHLSFITGGTWKGRDLFELLRETITPDWKMPELQPWWPESSRSNIINSITRLVRIWRNLGVLVFSTEGDGMDHLMYDEAVETQARKFEPKSADELESDLKKRADERLASDCSFRDYLNRDLDDAFWTDHWKKDIRFKLVDEDIFVRIFVALAGIREVKLAASLPNQGAIAGIKDRHVVEYTQYLFRDQIRPAGHFEIPDVVHGLIAAMASHQTMLGDALATGDPRLLAHALMAYPCHSFTNRARALNRDLIAVNAGRMSPALRSAVDYL